MIYGNSQCLLWYLDNSNIYIEYLAPNHFTKVPEATPNTIDPINIILTALSRIREFRTENIRTFRLLDLYWFRRRTLYYQGITRKKTLQICTWRHGCSVRLTLGALLRSERLSGRR